MTSHFGIVDDLIQDLLVAIPHTEVFCPAVRQEVSERFDAVCGKKTQRSHGEEVAVQGV